MIPQPILFPDGNWDFQTFTPNEVNPSSVLPQVWTKPAGCSLVFILLLGGGGGGGGGMSRASGLARGGGGGGGGGAAVMHLYPAPFVPAHLYLRPGKGGIGGAAMAAGTAGNNSYVYVNPQQQTSNGAFGAPAAPGNGGGAGTASAAGAAGTGGTAVAPAYVGGFYNGVGSGNGSAGGAQTGANGGSQFPGNMLTSGGAGGGGTTTGNFSGGTVDFMPNTFHRGAVLPGSFNPAIPDGLNGLNFGIIPSPHDIFSGNTNAGFGSGGNGGYAIDAGQAGNGGHASWGGGGGGGGAGVNGGAGGNGGDGLIIIGTM